MNEAIFKYCVIRFSYLGHKKSDIGFWLWEYEIPYL